jgi:hypothetical protein
MPGMIRGFFVALAAAYLAACTTFAALTGRSPVGNAHLAGIDEPTARLLVLTK